MLCQLNPALIRLSPVCVTSVQAQVITTPGPRSTWPERWYYISRRICKKQRKR
jgi:hypothetical protein